MHENAPVLTARTRERVGSRYAKRIREAGGLPAVVYGHRKTPESIWVDAHTALGHIHKGEKVFSLELDGAKSQHVLLKDVQFDYLGTDIIHADFTRVDLNERVHTRVPIHLIGEAVGLKAAGTVLMHPVTEIDIECLVANLPDFIEVDISGLHEGKSVYAGDVTLPLPTMKLVSDPKEVLAHIVTHSLVEETDEQAQVAEGAAQQPEVITERKKDEDESKG